MANKTKKVVKKITVDTARDEEKYVKEHLLTVKSKLIEFTKSFICAAVVSGSKGTKVVNFYQINNNSYDRNKPLRLHFDADETCLFESGKKYNFIISEFKKLEL
jgi:acid phosphatase class B